MTAMLFRMLKVLMAVFSIKGGPKRDPWITPVSSSRGTGWGMDKIAEFEALQELAWWYNWGPDGNSAAIGRSARLGVEFVPMQWGKWNIETLATDIHPAAKHLLGFNEPGHEEQANLQPQEAAELWPYLEAVAHDMGLKLGTPSPAPCGADCVRASPFDWWDEFFAACKDCHFDFLATHLYTCDSNMLRRFLTECTKYNLPIWLTEFSCPNGLHGTAQQQEQYMSAALQVITSMSEVHRYAWFAPRTSGDWLGVSASLLQPDKAELSSLGELYMQDAVSTHISRNWTFHSTDLLWSDVCDHCYSGEVGLLPSDIKITCQDCGFSTL